MPDDKFSPAAKDDNFKTLVSMTIEGNQSASISFPVPEHLKLHQSSRDHLEHAVEYYILARYSYFHRMNYAFMVNSFWAVEYLCLSILVFKFVKDDLAYHQLPEYWRMAKELVPPDASTQMARFDNYIAKVQGYFSERYGQPTPPRGKLLHTGKQPRVALGEASQKFSKFAKVAPLNLDEMDHFVNFMLHDVTIFKEGCSHNLGVLLDLSDNTGLYSQDNNFSVIFPNKKYNGELT